MLIPEPEGTLGFTRAGEIATLFWMLKHNLLVFPGPPGAVPSFCCGVTILFHKPGIGGLVNLLLLPKSILLNFAPSGVASTVPWPGRGVAGIDLLGTWA